MSNIVIQVINEAHFIAAELDIAVYHGGTPAFVTKSYDRKFTGGDYISLVAEKLESMGYEVSVELDVHRKNVSVLKACTRERGADQ